MGKDSVTRRCHGETQEPPEKPGKHDGWLTGGLGDSALWVTAHTGKRKLEPSGPALSRDPHRWRPSVTPTWWCPGSQCGTGGCTPARWPAWLWRCWTRSAPSASATGPRSSCACASASTRVRPPKDGRPALALSSSPYTRPYTYTSPYTHPWAPTDHRSHLLPLLGHPTLASPRSPSIPPTYSPELVCFHSLRTRVCWRGGAEDAPVLSLWGHSQHCLTNGV